jgi:uncharacterized protein
MLTSTEIIGFLRQNKPYISEHYYCSQIGLFGSFARNEQTEESDIDILVRFREDAPDLYSIELALKEYLKKQFNKEIDICSEKWIKPVFRPLVTKDAMYA